MGILERPAGKMRSCSGVKKRSLFLISCHTLPCEGVFHRLSSIIKFMQHLCHRSFSSGRIWKHSTVLMGSSPFSSATRTKAFSLGPCGPFPILWLSQSSSLSGNTCKFFKELILFAWIWNCVEITRLLSWQAAEKTTQISLSGFLPVLTIAAYTHMLSNFDDSTEATTSKTSCLVPENSPWLI